MKRHGFIPPLVRWQRSHSQATDDIDLYLGGYGLKGLYALEEYYARDLGGAETDITPWVDYFVAGVGDSFSKVGTRAGEAAREGGADTSDTLRSLDARQRKALALFRQHNEITAQDIGNLFDIQPRTARQWCVSWVESGFLTVTVSARKYCLSPKFHSLID